MEQKLILKPGREKSLRLKHPWIFSGAVANLEQLKKSEPKLVSVCDQKGDFLALAYTCFQSQIVARVLSWQLEEITPAFFGTKILAALQRRNHLNIPRVSDSYRVVFSENDGLPGLIIDLFNEYLVIQIQSAGMEHYLDILVDVCQDLFDPKAIILKNDAVARAGDGLQLYTKVAKGRIADQNIIIQEHGLKFYVDLEGSQKTGFFLDQRDNRALVGSLAKGKKVLNVFSFTGAFSVHCLKNGATHVSQIEISKPALDLSEANLALNGFKPNQYQSICADAFSELRKLDAQGDKFDLIILDPPKFAKNRSEVDRAARGYKDINRLALKMLSPFGLLATFTCSGSVDHDLFQKIIFGAALDAHRELQFIKKLGQGPDHPVSAFFPEGEYLKGFLCQAL